ncbi:MAG: hypothetical protein MUE42_01015 [Opitutaceae bacterium]|nr:hypothetical protein [Opitutaceae bacterium]
MQHVEGVGDDAANEHGGAVGGLAQAQHRILGEGDAGDVALVARGGVGEGAAPEIKEGARAVGCVGRDADLGDEIDQSAGGHPVDAIDGHGGLLRREHAVAIEIDEETTIEGLEGAGIGKKNEGQAEAVGGVAGVEQRVGQVNRRAGAGGGQEAGGGHGAIGFDDQAMHGQHGVGHQVGGDGVGATEPLEGGGRLIEDLGAGRRDRPGRR